MNKIHSLGGMSIEKIMVDWIYKNIPEGSTILEFGSGYGTAALVEKYKVYSIEHDLDWVNKIPGSNYIYAPIKNYGDYNWYDNSFIKKIDKINYKLLLIDGPAEDGERPGILKHLDLFYNGSIIIADDVERPEDKKLTEDICSLLNKSYTVITGTKSFAIIK